MAPSAPRKRPTSPGLSRSVVTDPKTASDASITRMPNQLPPSAAKPPNVVSGAISRSARRAKLPTLLPPSDQVRNSVDTSATTAPIALINAPRDSVAVTKAKLPAWSDLAPVLAACSSSASRSSGLRRLASARLSRVNRFMPSVACVWLIRSRTTATVNRARPADAPRATSRLFVARKTRRPRPPAPISAAIPSIEIANRSVWLRPVMMAGRANGS